MRLIDTLQRRAAQEESPFRAQLLREDVARLRRLRELARNNPDLTAFKAAGMRIGWTQGDARTQELRAPLERLLELVHEYETSDHGSELETAIDETWLELHRCRMERLLGCLATPAHKPAD
ncbi:MAG TPA: hypothetical protein VFB20_11620 [Burkholderiales bacterium]|nr:hypothetical protein [Burkholderiales bacterium]